MSTPDPWEQLPDEPDQWFAKFEAYFLPIPHEDRLFAAYKAYKAEKGKPEPKHIAGAWSRACKQYSWDQRARAYWSHVRVEAREAQADSVKEAQGRAAAAADDVMKEMVKIALGKAPCATREQILAADSILDRAGLPRLRAQDITIDDKRRPEETLTDEELAEELEHLEQIIHDAASTPE